MNKRVNFTIIANDSRYQFQDDQSCLVDIDRNIFEQVHHYVSDFWVNQQKKYYNRVIVYFNISTIYYTDDNNKIVEI